MLAYKVITQPTSEPIPLTQLKSHLNIDPTFTADDAILSVYLIAARKHAEKILRRAILPQTVLLSLDHFPYPHFSTSRRPSQRHEWFLADYLDQFAIELPLPSLISVTSITYVDGNGATQVLDPTTYNVDTISEPARITPASGLYWPIVTIYKLGSVQIAYVAGTYATPADVPETIQLGIMLLAAHWYANRESSSAVNLNSIPFGIENLLGMESASHMTIAGA